MNLTPAHRHPISNHRSDRAVVALFDDRIAAEDAVLDLERAGFNKHEVGFAIRGEHDVDGGTITDAVGTKDAKGAVAGALAGGVVGGVLAATLAVFLPAFGPVIAGGIVASFFGGAAAGAATGGILGALQGLGVSEDEGAGSSTRSGPAARSWP